MHISRCSNRFATLFNSPVRSLLLAVILVMLVMLSLSQQVFAQAGKVYVTDQASNQVTVIDATTLRVIKTIGVGDRPHNVNHTPDNKLVLVTNKNLATEDPPSLSLISTVTDEIVGEVTGIGSRIEHVVATSNSQALVSEDLGDNGVAVIDLIEKRVTTLVPTGIKPHGLWPTPDGRYVFVPNQLSGTVSKVDLQSMTVVGEAPVGRTPTMVAVSPDGKTAYVTLFGERGVAVLDAVSAEAGRLQVNDVIPVGEKPAQIAITPDGAFLLVPCEGPGALYVISTATHATAHVIPTGNRAHGVDVSTDGSRAFVSNWADNTVAVVDLKKGEVIAIIPVGREPAGIDFVPVPR